MEATQTKTAKPSTGIMTVNSVYIHLPYVNDQDKSIPFRDKIQSPDLKHQPGADAAVGQQDVVRVDPDQHKSFHGFAIPAEAAVYDRQAPGRVRGPGYGLEVYAGSIF
jgi:hypothetical protein